MRPSLITGVTSSPNGGFEFSEAYPAMIGAATGGLVAILVAVGTQVWQARSARRLRLEQQVTDAVIRLLAVLGDQKEDGWPGFVAVTSTSVLVRGTAKRAGYPQFDEVVSALMRPALSEWSSENYEDAAGNLASVAFACQWWLEDPTVFDRRRNARTVEDVRARWG